jgi:hypothetical protein
MAPLAWPSGRRDGAQSRALSTGGRPRVMAGLSFGTELAAAVPQPKERPPQGNCDGQVYMEETARSGGRKEDNRRLRPSSTSMMRASRRPADLFSTVGGDVAWLPPPRSKGVLNFKNRTHQTKDAVCTRGRS